MGSFDPHVDLTIVSLEAQVKELETTEAQLLPAVQQWEICQEALKRARASLAHLRNRKMPVSRLPDDVLNLIFEAGSRLDPVGHSDYFHKKSGNDRSLPFSIVCSHVSRTWRDVSIRDPFLWTTIEIVHSRPDDLCRMHVNRSKSCYLDVHFTCDAETARDFDPSILQLQRCRHLTILCYWYRSAFHIFERLQNETAPCLLSLKIDMQDTNEECEDQFPSEGYELFRKGAPFLSSVGMYGINLQSCKPPAGALTNLELRTPALASEMLFEEFLDTLDDMATTLTNLQIDGIFRVEHEDECFAVHLPSLVSLDIRYHDYIGEGQDDGDYIYNLWRCIKAPALESLSLHWMDGEQFQTVMNSLRLQRVASAKAGLKSLCLHHVDVDDHADDFTLACPNISDLTLIGDSTVPVLKFILETDRKSITSNTNTGLLWPTLRTLSVASYEDEILRAVVLSRKAIGHPLAKLCLANYSAGTADWYRQHIETVQNWSCPF